MNEVLIFGIKFLAVIYKLNFKKMINFMYHTRQENKLRFKQQQSMFTIIINSCIKYQLTLWVYLKVYFVMIWNHNFLRSRLGLLGLFWGNLRRALKLPISTGSKRQHIYREVQIETKFYNIQWSVSGAQSALQNLVELFETIKSSVQSSLESSPGFRLKPVNMMYWL